jgi:hypothetical protein
VQGACGAASTAPPPVPGFAPLPGQCIISLATPSVTFADASAAKFLLLNVAIVLPSTPVATAAVITAVGGSIILQRVAVLTHAGAAAAVTVAESQLFLDGALSSVASTLGRSAAHPTHCFEHSGVFPGWCGRPLRCHQILLVWQGGTPKRHASLFHARMQCEVTVRYTCSHHGTDTRTSRVSCPL